MKALLLALAITLLLTGCGFTPQGDALRGALQDRGAAAYDQAANNAKWFLREGASIGSIRRAYGTSQAKADAYRQLCEGESTARLLAPSPKAVPTQ